MADHSKSALCASGLSLEQIEEQHRKADRQILKGSRRPLGYTDNALDRFAFFVASIHGRFSLTERPRPSGFYGPSPTSTPRSRSHDGGYS